MAGSKYSLDGLRKLREILKKLLKKNEPQLQPERVTRLRIEKIQLKTVTPSKEN